MNRVIELVWDEDSDMSNVAEAMENVFWSVEAAMAMGSGLPTVVAGRHSNHCSATDKIFIC